MHIIAACNLATAAVIAQHSNTYCKMSFFGHAIPQTKVLLLLLMNMTSGRKKFEVDVGMGVVGSHPTSYVLAATMWLCRT